MSIRESKGEEILDLFIKSVVDSEDIFDFEEELEEQVYRPKLKIYYVESFVTPNKINKILDESINFSKKIRNLLTDYKVEIIEKEKPYWLIVFTDKKYQDEHFFLLRIVNSYWEIFTIVHHKIVTKTIQKLFDISDKIDPVWISRNRLIEIVSDLVTESGIRGFTAKRRTLNFKKDVTIRVYGGDLEDIEKARKDFYCEPINIFFKRKNSPIDAIVGAIGIDGYLRIDRIRSDSIDFFKETKNQLWNKYKESYDSIVTSIDKLGKEIIKDNKKPIATRYNSFFSLTFSIDNEEYWEDNRIFKAINKQFLEDGNQYIGYTLGDDDVMYIFDLQFRGCFRLRIDRKNRKVIICPEENTTKKSISKFSNLFIENIEHSAKPEHYLEVFA